jgi:predicted MPP superfamily phosphohydrolase
MFILSIKHSLKISIFGILIAVILLLAYGFWFEPNNIQVERVNLEVAHLPPSTKDIKFVLFSDLNFSGVGYRERKLKEIINNQIKPDFILFAGDYFEEGAAIDRNALLADKRSGLLIQDTRVIFEGLDFFASLKSTYNKYLIWGEADAVFARYLRDLWESRGVRVLTTNSETLSINGVTLNILGPHHPNIMKEKTARFEILGSGKNKVLSSGSSSLNSYAHYYGKGALKWTNYEFSGKMKITDSRDSIGVTFYSQSIFPDDVEWYYRLRRYEGEDFYIDPKGTQITGGRIRSYVIPQPGSWYRFKIRVQNKQNNTQIKGKIWQNGHVEPLEWQIDCIDDSMLRSTQGTVGVWTRTGKGQKLFDNFVVVSFDGEQPGKLLLKETFELPSLENQMWASNRMQKKPIPNGDFNLLLAHNPDIIKSIITDNIDLVVAGHTHGGQVRLPFLGPLYSQTSLGRRFSAGLFEFPETHLYVTRGIGTSIIPFRFLCRPEITLFHLTGKQ